MKFLGDMMVENGRLRRSLTTWKVLFFLVLLGFVGGFGLSSLREQSPLGHYIARVSFSGNISDDPERDRRIRAIAENPKVKAVIMVINSPGGTVFGSESFYRALKKVSDTKPVVAVAEGAMASGGYMVAVAANYIIAHNSSAVGSIGVVAQSMNYAKLAEHLGIKMNIVRSGKLKAVPSSYEDFSDDAKHSLEKSVEVLNEYFQSLVLSKRGITDIEKMQKISTGRIFIGQDAVEVSLVDEIGDETNAVEWLNKNGIFGKVRDLPISGKKGMSLKDISSAFRLFVSNVILEGTLDLVRPKAIELSQ